MIILSMVLSFIGFMHLAMVLKAHYKVIVKGKITNLQNITFHLLGWSLVALSLWPCLIHWNLGIAITVWFGVLTLSSMLVVALLSYFVKIFALLWRYTCPGARLV